jgi:hypothetical protein
MAKLSGWGVANMRASARVGLGLAVAASLTACGPGSGQVAAPYTLITSSPSPSVSGSATPTPSVAATLGPFAGPATELQALFDRMRAAGPFRVHVHQSPDPYGSATALVYDVAYHFDPLSWRQRTLDPSLVDDTIRAGEDLYDNALSNCAKSATLTGWKLFARAGLGSAPDAGFALQFAPGLLPTALNALQYLTLSSRHPDGAGYLVRGTVASAEAGDFDYEPAAGNDAALPIVLRLDANGLPLEYSVDYSGAKKPSASFIVTFSRDAVPPIPQVHDAPTFSPNAMRCTSGSPSPSPSPSRTASPTPRPSSTPSRH